MPNKKGNLKMLLYKGALKQGFVNNNSISMWRKCDGEMLERYRRKENSDIFQGTNEVSSFNLKKDINYFFNFQYYLFVEKENFVEISVKIAHDFGNDRHLTAENPDEIEELSLSLEQISLKRDFFENMVSLEN